MFSKATMKERRQYYREEWSEKDLPEFIRDGIKKRNFQRNRVFKKIP